MDVVADAVLVEELVELLVVDAMRPLHFSVQTRGARADVDVANVAPFEVPVEFRLELGAVVGLHDVYAEGQAAEDLVDEECGCPLGAGIVDLEDANSRAIVDGGELIQPLTSAGDSLQELPSSCNRCPGCGFS